MDRALYYQKILEHRRDELETRILEIEDRLDDQMDVELERVGSKPRDDQILEMQLRDAYKEFQCVYSALNRIKVKTFGRCIVCHSKLSDEQLNAQPHARFCLTCRLLQGDET